VEIFENLRNEKAVNISNCFLLWQYELWSFQTGDTKLEIFLPKNQHTQKKLLNFEFWINGKLSKRLASKTAISKTATL
jgi:hypothetical protein